MDASTSTNDVKFAYFHEALDIVRSSDTSDDEVHAPLAGLATVVF
jgi:hypothetical protein